MTRVVGTDLNDIQRKLHDAPTLGDDGMIWSRAELLGWYNEGYRQLLALTHATQRFTVLEVPPRYTATGTQEWMARYANGGSFMQWAHAAEGDWAVSSLWQIEALEGTTQTPTNARHNMSQPWYRTYEQNTDAHFRFALPRDNERIVKIWYNDKLLVPLYTRNLDDLRTNWYSLEGEPLTWTLGTGRNRTFEIFSIVTVVTDTYKPVDDLTGESSPQHGIVRRLTGDRIYQARAADGGLPFGIPRRVISESRQYYPRPDEPLRSPFGRNYRWSSSNHALLVLDAHVPDMGVLQERDEPVLIPRQLQKYVKYFTWARAFNRQGEGYNPNMAAFYEARFQRGVVFLRNLAMLTRKSSHQARKMQQRHERRPRMPQFPADYPRVTR